MTQLAQNSSAWQRLRRQILDRDHETCHYCGAHATHVDHVIPRKLAGDDADDPANLVAACASCNLRKGDRIRRPAPNRPTIRPLWTGTP